MTRIEHGVETSYTLTFGCRKVRLPGRSEPLYLLVIRGFGAKPMLLLTNEPLRPSFKSLWRMMQAYLKRWSIEETIRYIKTCYDLENVRVLNYQGLQNLMPLVLAVVFFLACILDQDTRLRVMANYIEKAAKRLFGVPDFKYYALADGLHALLTRYTGKPQPQSRAPNSRQMELLLFCYR
ncbi:MAG: hypothetical protein KAI25_04310 [Hyphomicrobiaceae bacterium]|nr:hypothetical protein [Hyphomicrobiaceae bacterium]